MSKEEVEEEIPEKEESWEAKKYRIYADYKAGMHPSEIIKKHRIRFDYLKKAIAEVEAEKGLVPPPPTAESKAILTPPSPPGLENVMIIPRGDIDRIREKLRAEDRKIFEEWLIGVERQQSTYKSTLGQPQTQTASRPQVQSEAVAPSGAMTADFAKFMKDLQAIEMEAIKWGKYLQTLEKFGFLPKGVRKEGEESPRLLEEIRKLKEEFEALRGKSEMDRLREDIERRIEKIETLVSGGGRPSKELEALKDELARLREDKRIMELAEKIREGLKESRPDLAGWFQQYMSLQEQLRREHEERMEKLRLEYETRIRELEKAKDEAAERARLAEIKHLRDEIENLKGQSGPDSFFSTLELLDRLEDRLDKRAEKLLKRGGGKTSEVKDLLETTLGVLGPSLIKPLGEAVATRVSQVKSTSSLPSGSMRYMTCEKCGTQIPIPSEETNFLTCPNCGRIYLQKKALKVLEKLKEVDPEEYNRLIRNPIELRKFLSKI